jgi:excisionase family DNA binding protein
MDEEYLSTEQVAELLKCSTVSVQRYIARGHFPGTQKMDPTRKNSGFRIPRAAVDNFRKLQVVTPVIQPDQS